MKETRRKELIRKSRRLKTCETALENAKEAFADELLAAVKDDKCSLGEVAKALADTSHPITRQRVHQIVHEHFEKVEV